MRRFVVFLCAAVALSGALLGIATAGGKSSPEVVERGRYLVEVVGCAECHSPWRMGAKGPEIDGSRMFSGHPEGTELPSPPELPPGPWNAITGGMTAWAGPWGISYATNLTSDPDTGLGAWTEEQFVAALHTGKHLGMGRDILPPMPHYAAASTEDLKAMFAYFMTVPPIHNQVPDPVLPKQAQGAKP